jgi:hypothetical protein
MIPNADHQKNDEMVNKLFEELNEYAKMENMIHAKEWRSKEATTADKSVETTQSPAADYVQDDTDDSRPASAQVDLGTGISRHRRHCPFCKLRDLFG